MNEFLEQFLVEARELVEQASGDLLALEDQPDDRARLDSAFRAVHTLKGAAGIVEFDAMTRLMHMAEDRLAAVRAGTEAVTAALIDDGLAALDLLTQWLDAIEAEGDLPAGADAQAAALAGRFQSMSSEAAADAIAGDARSDAWLGDLLAQYPEAAAEARSAFIFTPQQDSFFAGEDPLAQVSSVPGLLALDIQLADEHPRLDRLDPFLCDMAFIGLASIAPDDVLATFARVKGLIEIRDLRLIGLGAEPAPATFSKAAAALIEAQIALLSDISGRADFAGRLDAAARVAVSVLRQCGRFESAADVEAAAAHSLEVSDARALLDALEAQRPSTPANAAAVAVRPAEVQDSITRVRVDVERIDRLVKLVGELIIVKNAIAHIAASAGQASDTASIVSALKDQSASFERLLGQMQSGVLSLRVLPLRHVFQRFPKLVREMAAQAGKSARLVTEGDATEADKTIVEALFEPLLHVLRNAVDHGIESHEARSVLNKPAQATIWLRARRLGEAFVVEVEDDGQGVDIERVRAVALQRGVASPDVLAAMSREEVIELIFQPGFSTATDVTDLSGRGVGMDAVRAAISRLGGDVRIESLPQRGSIVRFTLPYSVMMTRIMTVEADGQTFGIPFDAIAETLRVPRSQIQPLGPLRAIVVRERTIPLLRLSECLGAAAGSETPEADIVIAQVAGELAALEVERVGTRMEVMLQPMEGLLSTMPGIAGTALLGDGCVLLVLDLEDLLR